MTTTTMIDTPCPIARAAAAVRSGNQGFLVSESFITRIGARSRRKRTWPALLLVGLLMSAGSAPAPAGPAWDPVELTASPVVLNPSDAEQTRVGRLAWRGGVEITSRDSRVGGFSGLVVSPDGGRLIAVSDKGHWFTAEIRYDGRRHLTALESGRVAAMRGLDGEILSKKKWRDAEDLAELEDGNYLVSFERKHRIWRYDASKGFTGASATGWTEPNGFAGLRKNRGIEALVVLPGQEMLALAQGRADGTESAGFLWQGRNWSHVTYHRPRGFAPSGAARLPKGDIVVLERKQLTGAGYAVRLVRLPISDVARGGELRGEELARWRVPLTVENFEGVAVRKGAQDETLVYLLSDDDLTKNRRTLLLMFALAGN